MNKLLILLMILTACNSRSIDSYDANIVYDASVPDASKTSIFYRCDAGNGPCETGLCSSLTSIKDGQEPLAEVCTERCEVQGDCTAINPESFCICDYTEDGVCYFNDKEHGTTPAHCLLRCWPEEDRRVCDRYGIFCPSDCQAQGLECLLVTIFPFNYACRPPY